MRQVIGDQLGDFAAIYDEDVEVVSVTRPQARTCEALAERLVRSRQVPQLRWVQSADDPVAPASELPSTIDADVRSALLDQIAEASEMLGELMDCERVGVRLETLSAPMCPRFHADHVPCRMLITLSGVGTEWIPNSDVDWAVFADRGTTAPPIQANRQIQRFTTGHWSLLKGGAWNDGFDGVVHRSPHGVGERLLLSLDPVY
ncbi:MAG: DUF1826 domain-containing protein [Gammaproteobacteria bacterium]|nr:DUF1826 domain-containing protein [Gammaproteobacteria bacterium]